MGRYSKVNSNYVLKKKHLDTSKGTIYERDWVTLGETRILEPGKRPIYFDGHFLFTDNSRITTRKRHRFGTEVASWTYDEVSDASPKSNEVAVNLRSDDMRDFAYYGSCRELVRASALNILNNFPANIRSASYTLKLADGSDTGKYALMNDFNIDFLHELPSDAQYENRLRYIRTSWADYNVNGSAVASYFVDVFLVDKECLENNEGHVVAEITITTDDENVYTLTGYYNYGEIAFTTNLDNLLIQPKDSLIEGYFNSLDGFEKLMLSRDSKPKYTMRLVTPMEKGDEEGFVYVYREYTWPSYGYCIAANTPAYYSYLEELYGIADKFDSYWCDNLYRNMTHEAIKNFDWTYTRDYAEGEEAEFVDGGEIMTDLLRVTGRMFDDLKRSIDGIRQTSTVTYDGNNNITDAEITDRLELEGWDIVSVIPPIKIDMGGEEYTPALSDTRIDAYAIYGNVSEKGKINVRTQNRKSDDDSGYITNISTHGKWFNALSDDGFTASDVEVDFMRQLKMSSRHLFGAKGTVHSLESLLAMFGLGRGVDYEIGEGYKTVVPKPMFFEGAEGVGEIDNTENVVELIAGLAHQDVYAKIYDMDKPFDNVPFGILRYGNRNYLIPQYDSNRPLLNNYMYFQGNGGWGKHGDSDGNPYTYTETMSYLKTVDNVYALLNVNARSVTTGDIYYVYDVMSLVDGSDEIQGDIEGLLPPSHFFVLLNDATPEKYSSWRCIIMDEEAEDFVDDIYYRKAKYLDRLISVNTGNNPHSGYGRYDMGNLYDTNMSTPFQHASKDAANDETLLDMFSSDYTFPMDKYGVIDSGYEHSYDKYADGEVMGTEVDMWDCQKVLSFGGDDDIEEITGMLNKYYLNDKTLVIKNLHEDSQLFKEYFMNVIFPYLAQMIPSTAILRLDGFVDTTEPEETDDESNMANYYSASGVQYTDEEETGESGD